MNALPIGLAGGVGAVTQAVNSGEVLRQLDVALDATDPALRLRREMEGAA